MIAGEIGVDGGPVPIRPDGDVARALSQGTPREDGPRLTQAGAGGFGKAQRAAKANSDDAVRAAPKTIDIRIGKLRDQRSDVDFDDFNEGVVVVHNTNLFCSSRMLSMAFCQFSSHSNSF